MNSYIGMPRDRGSNVMSQNAISLVAGIPMNKLNKFIPFKGFKVVPLAKMASPEP